MLSQGPFTYNRFDVLAEKAKPDFLDMDKDGDKKESMKKAVSDKKDGKKCKDCGKKDCGCDDKKSDKKDSKMPPWLKKEEVQEIEFSDAADFLIGEGICNDVNGAEMWLENATDDTLGMLAHQISEKAGCGDKGGIRYPTEPKKKFTKDKTDPGVAAGRKAAKEMGLKMNETINKNDVLEYMMETNMVNNSVSAEALFNHISDEFLEEIEKDIMEGFQSLPAGKMAKQAGKAFGKEQDAVSKGDSAGANKQMQRRIAMNNPMGRKAQLGKDKKKGY